MKNLENFNSTKNEIKENPDNKIDNVEKKNPESSDTQLENKPVEFDKLDSKLQENVDNLENFEVGTPRDGAGGSWDGERGNSIWTPDPEKVPTNPLTNPEGKSFQQILGERGQSGVEFIKGEPDFTPFAEATVKIDNFSENRYGAGGNFNQALEKYADQRGESTAETKTYMKDEHLTFHERSDCKTMDVVPTEVHGNVRHTGGVSVFKQHLEEEG